MNDNPLYATQARIRKAARIMRAAIVQGPFRGMHAHAAKYRRAVRRAIARIATWHEMQARHRDEQP